MTAKQNPRTFKTAWVVVGVAAACSPPDISMSLELPGDLAGQTAWIEIGAFPKSCPNDVELAGGLPPSGLAARIAYAADASPLPLGQLDTSSYGFAAVARRDDCGVIATGCANANVASARAINISLADSVGDPDASACTNGLVCDQARCVPPVGDDPSAGAGCSMVLVGAGPLPDPLDGGPFVTAPAIVANASGGFFITYAEYLSADGTERLTVLPIDSGGGALAADQQTLDGHCAGQTSIDAAAIATTGTSTLAIVSRAPCMGQSGLELFPLDPNGNVIKRNLFLNATAPSIALSTHALTPAQTAGRYLLALNVGGSATLLSTDGTGVSAQTTTAFGTSQDGAVRVVRDGAVAVEVDGPSVGDAGIPGTVARLYLTSASADPATLGSPVAQTSAQITALTVLGSRAFLTTNASTPNDDVTVFAYDLGSSTSPFGPLGYAAKGTTVLALDSAVAQNRMFSALEQQDAISVAVFDGAASSVPEILRIVDLSSDIRIPKSAHDGPIAIAATNARVAVTWVGHQKAFTDGESLGGYAVFACKP